jgi:transketolase
MARQSDALIAELAELAMELRRDVVNMVHCAGSGHLGGSLSAAELVTALYFHHLRIDPDRPDWPDRDRFILSKGHAAPLLYATLARRGFIQKEELDTFRQLGSCLQGHPDRLKLPGVEMTAGLLGHGISLGVGMALAARLSGRDHHTYVLVGDGETQAGVIWEGAMAAAKYRLSTLTVILDRNGVQLDGPVADIMPLEPVIDKWRAFNWQVIEIDGHDMRQVLDSLVSARESGTGPTIIVAHTTKGKGVSFMEGQAAWHGRAPDDGQCAQALEELACGSEGL